MNLNALHISAANGDKSSEKELFQSLSVRFRLFLYQRVWDEEDAKEIVQDALSKIFRAYRQVEIEISFSAWAYKVLINELNHYIRKRRREGRSVELVSDAEAGVGSWIPDPLLEAKLLVCLHKIGRTHRRYARVLNLKHQGYSAEEISAKLGVTPGNFYVILSRARSALNSCLEKGVVP